MLLLFLYNEPRFGKNNIEVINVKEKVNQMFKDKLFLVMLVLGLLTMVAAAGVITVQRQKGKGENPYLEIPKEELIAKEEALPQTAADSQAGTFLINTDGELIGWAVDDYGQEDHSSMTAVMSVSDYKGALELMSNGLPVPYFGILGQEITAAMAQKGMPKGIYISEAVMDSPAYNAGLQPGDILTKLGDMPVTNLKEFQGQVEKLQAGTKIIVNVQRSNGKDEYREIPFEITVGTR